MSLHPYVQQILTNPVASLAVVGNLVIIESLLSVDNAAVLATMVSDLPDAQRSKALRYGIVGAYVFRILCLFFASYLIRFWYLKPVGGLYLLYLTYDHFRPHPATEVDDGDGQQLKRRSWVYRQSIGRLGQFWATVVLVEVMDVVFSIDNVFAVVAFSKNLILVAVGVCIGILAMRLVAQAFVLLLARYPFLETAAFVVIGVLGLKLLLSVLGHLWVGNTVSHFLDSDVAEVGLTGITVGIIGVPWLTSLLFNVPQHTRGGQGAGE